MARRQPDQPPVILNGFCCGCQRDRDLYRVEDSRYRCADCYETEKGVRPWLAPPRKAEG